ncbi:MAG: RnfABCDGE type electron transport complex subunit D [Elusimicrobia bacterium]|nr:RnfABCDGE type electron transport complex subunit D [Elusimicrobiota bacterium]
MEKKFEVTVSPHIFSKRSVRTVMLEVCIALIPAFVFSIRLWGLSILKTYITAIFFAHLSEWVFLKIRKKNFEFDGSALVTAVLFVMTLPPTVSLFAVAVGVSFGIIFGKQFFGGLGHNVFNPALLGRAFLVASFPTEMTTWISHIDATTTATPLGAWKFAGEATWEIKKIFLGTCPGSIGETSALLLIIGGIYLIIRKIVDWRIPVFYILTVFILSSVFYFFDATKGNPFFHLFAGGLMLGAFFMATDPVTAPANLKARILFATGCGILTLVIRYFGGYPEGVMYSILIMNAFAPLLEKIEDFSPFGL